MNNFAQASVYPDARFWNRIAKRYAEKPVPDQQIYEDKLAKTNSFLRPTDHVLEIGCGTGTTAIHHAPSVAHVRATDISECMIEIARSKARVAEVQNIDFEMTSVEKLNAAPNSFDVILAHSILHLVPRVDRALVQLHQMLEPGGLFISSTPCIRDFFPLFRYFGPLGRSLGVLPRVNVFGEAELDRWLSAAGFTIEERWRPRQKSGVYIVARKPNEQPNATVRLSHERTG
jgi:ubiquinone/menaquinone biosynthesis C-methylase UbiE